LWFTDEGTNGIGNISTSGKVTTFPNLLFGPPIGITLGPDGNLWFQAQDYYGTVGKISTTGTTTLFSQIGVTVNSEDIVAGPDGALWIPESGYYAGNPQIAVVGTDGTLLDQVGTSYVGGVADGITVGPDHKLWVTLLYGGRVSRLSAIHGSGDSIQGTVGQQYSGTVATFVDGTPTAVQTDFSATIDWGDGTTGAGAVSGPMGGPFAVTGSHAFVQSGALSFTVTLHESVDNTDYHTTGAATVYPQSFTSSIGLVSSLNPAAAGQKITFTATVSSPFGQPTGQVLFEDFGSEIGSGMLSAGAAPFSTTALAAGPHEIAAVYEGDTLHTGSTSNTVDQIVTSAGQAASGIGLTPSKIFLTGRLDQRSVTLTATVTGSGATGTVAFYSGTHLLGTVMLDKTGTAALVTDQLKVAGNAVTAAYSGDPSFAASISPVVAVYRSPEPRCAGSNCR
jgi:hypothetical protein